MDSIWINKEKASRVFLIKDIKDRKAGGEYYYIESKQKSGKTELSLFFIYDKDGEYIEYIDIEYKFNIYYKTLKEYRKQKLLKIQSYIEPI